MVFDSNSGLNTRMSELLSEIDIPVEGTHGEQYEIISRVAYLIGVPKRIFDNEHEPPKIEIYQKLEREKESADHKREIILGVTI